MGTLRASLLAGGSGLIALVGTISVAQPASAGVAGQFAQNGQFPVGAMTLDQPSKLIPSPQAERQIVVCGTSREG